MRDDTVYFVYLKGVGCKPYPQKWYGDQTTGTDGPQHKGDLLFIKEITGDLAKLPINSLVTMFPPGSVV
jgi:hypothetical protein